MSNKVKKLKYQILIEKAASKVLKDIPNPFKNKIITAIKKLSNNPRPSNSKKLTGRNAWRIRVGNYRFIYEIKDKESVVLIITLGHRKEIYR
jgi:mRNA interferase RelE/StbE